MVDWSFFTDEGFGVQALYVLLGIVLIALAPGFLNLAAFAMGNVETPFWKSLLLGFPTFLATLIIGHFVSLEVMSARADAPEANPFKYYAGGAGITLGASFILGLIVYGVVLKGRFLKSTYISLIETFLRVLYVVLAWGIVAMILAIRQVAQEEQGRDALIKIGIVFGGLIAVVVILFLVTSNLRSSPTRR